MHSRCAAGKTHDSANSLKKQHYHANWNKSYVPQGCGFKLIAFMFPFACEILHWFYPGTCPVNFAEYLLKIDRNKY